MAILLNMYSELFAINDRYMLALLARSVARARMLDTVNQSSIDILVQATVVLVLEKHARAPFHCSRAHLLCSLSRHRFSLSRLCSITADLQSAPDCDRETHP